VTDGGIWRYLDTHQCRVHPNTTQLPKKGFVRLVLNWSGKTFFMLLLNIFTTALNFDIDPALISSN
jgi:hypothetical protein